MMQKRRCLSRLAALSAIAFALVALAPFYLNELAFQLVDQAQRFGNSIRTPSERSHVARHSMALQRLSGGPELLSELEPTLEPFSLLAPYELGLPDEQDLQELVALMEVSFDRMFTKGRLPDFLGPIATVWNVGSQMNNLKEITKGLDFRLDLRMQFPSLQRPVKADETVAIIVRKLSDSGRGKGEVIAYVELCILAADGRRPEDPNTAAPEGFRREPYLSNLCVAPEYRRRGLGRALLAVAEALVVNIWKDKRMYLHIDSAVPPRKLYESAGYQEVTATDRDGITHMFKILAPDDPEVPEVEEDDSTNSDMNSEPESLPVASE